MLKTGLPPLTSKLKSMCNLTEYKSWPAPSMMHVDLSRRKRLSETYGKCQESQFKEKILWLKIMRIQLLLNMRDKKLHSLSLR